MGITVQAYAAVPVGNVMLNVRAYRPSTVDACGHGPLISPHPIPPAFVVTWQRGCPLLPIPVLLCSALLCSALLCSALCRFLLQLLLSPTLPALVLPCFNSSLLKISQPWLIRYILSPYF